MKLTARQQQILDFILKWQRGRGFMPTYQEIANHFGFRSINSVTQHVRLLRQKGALSNQPGRARSFRVLSPLGTLRNETVDIPVLGTIAAGFAQDAEQEVVGCVSVDVGTLGIRPTTQTFAVKVKGDSMIGKHILPGDTAVAERDATPSPGDVVVALIDGESTLKTFVRQRGAAFLRAENPHYPDLRPAAELLIQGVVVALIRSSKMLALATAFCGLVMARAGQLFSAC